MAAAAPGAAAAPSASAVYIQSLTEETTPQSTKKASSNSLDLSTVVGKQATPKPKAAPTGQKYTTSEAFSTPTTPASRRAYNEEGEYLLPGVTPKGKREAGQKGWLVGFYHALNTHGHRSFLVDFIYWVIVANAIVYVISTINVGKGEDEGKFPCFRDKMDCVRLGKKYGALVLLFEGCSVLLFTAEYLVRMFFFYKNPHGNSFWKEATKFLNLVDLVAIVPWYLDLVGIIYAPHTQVLRILRCFNMLQSPKYVSAFSALNTVVKAKKEAIIFTLFLYSIYVLLATILIYNLEFGNDTEGAKYYQSIPAGLLPTMLFTLGNVPVWDFGIGARVVTTILATTSVVIYAVPTAVLTAGFVTYFLSRQAN